MKRYKRTISVVMVFVLILTGLRVSPGLTKAAEQPEFYADSVTAEPGSEIEIPIKISGNPGIMGLGLEVKFDREVLTPLDETKHSDFLEGQFNDSIEGALKDAADNFIVLWSGTENMSRNGELFILKFQVSEQAAGSTEIILTLRQGDTFNENFADVTVECQPVTIKIESGGTSDDTPTRTPEPEETPTKAPEPVETEAFPNESKEPLPAASAPVPTATRNPSVTGNPAATKQPAPVSEPKITEQPSSSEKGSSGSPASGLRKPGKISLKKVKALGKGKVKIRWSWKAVGGFEVQYAQNRAFTKKKKTKDKNGSVKTMIVKKLKRGKTYYFRVRAYNKSGSKKKYGSWSKVRKCKVK